MALALLIGGALLPAADMNFPTLPLGAKAPDFHLRGVDGREYSLADFDSAKVLVIVFTCDHCPTAQAYEERLRRFVFDYRDKGVALVAISPNDANSIRLDELGYTDLSDSFEEMKIRAKAHYFNFPYLYDGDQHGVARAYGPTATPHAFVFGRERRLRYAGRVDDSEREPLVKSHDLRNAIEALLAGREVPVKQTKAFGCSIKWAGKAELVRQYMAKLAAEPVSVEPADAAALSALRKNDSGKLRLVNLWATWCGPCLTEFADLVTINRMYRHRAFEFVSVSTNYPDEKKDVLQFLTKEQASNRNLIFAATEKYKLMDAFDPQWNDSLPYTLLIAPGGEVLYRAQGPIDALELKRAIVRALKDDRFR